jgi:PAS domain S-box-containing protein
MASVKVGGLRKRFRALSLKNRIFISTFAVVVLLSIGIALDTRIVLVSGLTAELETRGIAIAQSIADQGKGYILAKDYTKLASLVFDAVHLQERRQLISYVFVQDQHGEVLSHSFVEPFPHGLGSANPVPADAPLSVSLVSLRDESAYDIAVPIREGISQIGTVHVGLSKRHIDDLIGKLRITYLGIIFAIILIFFAISQWLANYITRPISALTRMADEVSRGNLDIQTDLGGDLQCWVVKGCEDADCPAHSSTAFPCWYVDGTKHSGVGTPDPTSRRPESCTQCDVFKKRGKDEVSRLADSFIHMTNRLKLSQIKRQESEEKYRSLFDSGPNPVFVLDRGTLDILDANPSAEAVYGYARTELVGVSFLELGTFQDDRTGLSVFAADPTEASCLVYQKARHYTKDRRAFYVNMHACPTRYMDKEAVIVATTDVTEMIEKEAQLIQASKMTMLGEMSAGMAHELNQPLNAIKMGNDYLKMMTEEGKRVPDQDLLYVVGEVSQQVDRASEIIQRLREFGRKADFTREKVDINTVIRNARKILGQQLTLQDIEVRMELAESLPLISGHANRLEQVLFNLITNARDAIHQKRLTQGADSPGLITIRSYREGNRVGITVSDSGVGIPESIRDRIFEPFFTTKEVGKGMGLGLSIIYGIVTDHGGEIQIQSQEGIGTTFTITFQGLPA